MAVPVAHGSRSLLWAPLIVAEGGVLSELPLGVVPVGYSFPVGVDDLLDLCEEFGLVDSEDSALAYVKTTPLSLGGFVNPYSFLLAILLVLWGFQFITIGLLSRLVLQIRRQVEGALRETR
jgi:hypothetical protein